MCETLGVSSAGMAIMLEARPVSAYRDGVGVLHGRRRWRALCPNTRRLCGTDGHDGQLLIDLAIEITSRSDGAPELREAETKAASVRAVALNADTVGIIDALRRARGSYGPWMCGLGPELVSPDRISCWRKRARQTSGIGPKWRLYDVRNWSATVAIGQGHDVRTVAGRLGHANPAMTLRVYAHAFAAADQAVAAGLGEMLKGDGK
jgi:integrase